MNETQAQKTEAIEAALATEIRNCHEANDDEWLRGRCYGLAHALAILNESSTDEELWRVVDGASLREIAEPLFKAT